MSLEDDKVTVENVNVPGQTTAVSAVKYQAMKTALLNVLPQATPGLTQGETIDAAKLHPPEDLFPGGSTAGWWVKCVQLDLEAKGQVLREQTKPLRWHQV